MTGPAVVRLSGHFDACPPGSLGRGRVSPLSESLHQRHKARHSALVGWRVVLRVQTGQFREENSPVGQPPVFTFYFLLVHLTMWTSFPAAIEIQRDLGCPLPLTAWTMSASLGCGLSVSENLPTGSPINKVTGLRKSGLCRAG